MLEELFQKTVEKLKDKIDNDEATSADLAVAAKILKDNSIRATPTPGNPDKILKKQDENDYINPCNVLPFQGNSSG